MKFTFSWLKQYLDLNCKENEIVDFLTNIGLEVENIEDLSCRLKHFVVSEIKSCIAHPNANKLKICMVDIGENNLVKVVCGANNVYKGLKTVYAPIGSIIPVNNLKINKVKIRGEESFGMLCSETELMIGSDSDGIIKINDKFQPGDKIAKIYGFDDKILEINITPNRGDCLSVYGIARDLSAVNAGKLKKIEYKTSSLPTIPKTDFKVNVETSKCSNIAFAIINNIQDILLPDNLLHKLKSVCLDTDFAIVNFANYVMHSLGNPLHVYDADKINGTIRIREALEGEEFTSISGEKYLLRGGEIIAVDDEKIISLSGIIGSNNSSFSHKTSNILIEAGSFDSLSISKSGKELNILSDSRYRFERGVDENLIFDAIYHIIDLICNSGNAEINDIYFHNLSVKNYRKNISFRIDKVEQLLGIKIEEDRIFNILQKLQFKIENIENNIINVQVPNFRKDINIEEDLIEEIIRIVGYNKIKSLKPIIQNLSKVKTTKLEKVRASLCNNSLNEIISWSFIKKSDASLFKKIESQMLIKNPISLDYEYMRPNLLPGLINAFKGNVLRNSNNLSFFEIGKVFSEKSENLHISSLRSGSNLEKNIYKSSRQIDVMDIKKDFFDALSVFNIEEENTQFDNKLPHYYHPYKSSKVTINQNVIIGYFGQLHPITCSNLKIKDNLFIFEIFVDNIPNKNKKKERFIISDLPIVERDFSFIIPSEVKIGEVIKVIQSTDKQLIQEVNIFDIYKGNNVEKNKKSIGISIKIRPFKTTLTKEKIDDISNILISKMEEKYGAKLRDKIND